jgi:hypothetical protein
MKSWISILSLLFLSGEALAACRFKDELKKVYSLSGPLTVALKEIGLLRDPKLRGISIFNPVGLTEFSGTIVPGGIFLSREAMDELKGAVVFFDEGRELARTLPKGSVQFITRGLTPPQVVERSIEVLRNHTQDCEKEFAIFSNRTQELAKKVLDLMRRAPRAVFFLGEIKNRRPPEMVIANDGIVKWLKDQTRLTTYPSDLGYVTWSMKLLQELHKDTLRVGIIDSGRVGEMKVQRLDKNSFNLRAPGSLVPGITQLKAWLYFLEAIRE